MFIYVILCWKHSFLPNCFKYLCKRIDRKLVEIEDEQENRYKANRVKLLNGKSHRQTKITLNFVLGV